MKDLRIAKDLALPLDVVTQAIGILAKRRAGKSYLMRRLVEQLFGAGQQVVLVDPKGDQWGVRSSADGLRPGLGLVIFGGERADVPLEPSSGALLAKLVVEESLSAVLDLSLLRKHEIATFMAAFLEDLYRLKAREQHRTPMMLVIDEADAVAPQKPQPNETRMLGAAQDIVRRGGQRGIGCCMVTQRSAVLSKDVLTQVQMLVTLRTIAPQDLAAIKAWIDVHGTVEQQKVLMASLPALPVGDAWFWSPGWPTDEGIFQRSHVLPITTFDSGATPKPGQVRSEPKKLCDVDLEAVRRQMAETLERAKADDPKALRARIAELESKLNSVTVPVPKTERVEVTVFDEQRFNLLFEALAGQADAVTAAAASAKDSIGQALVAYRNEQRAKAAHPMHIMAPELAPNDGKTFVITAPPNGTNLYDGGRKLSPSRVEEAPKGEAAVLAALAQHQHGCSKKQLRILTRYKRSTLDAYLQRLRTGEAVTVAGDRFLITVAGRRKLPADWKALPKGGELRRHYLATLPTGEAKVLEYLIKAAGESLSRDDLSIATGFARSSRDAYIQRLKARELVETNGTAVRAAGTLFE